MANQSHAANMTQGSIWKLMVRFAIPIFLGNLFQQFYNVADTFIVGNVLGTEAMAAVGSSGNLIFMLIGFFQGVFFQLLRFFHCALQQFAAFNICFFKLACSGFICLQYFCYHIHIILPFQAG